MASNPASGIRRHPWALAIGALMLAITIVLIIRITHDRAGRIAEASRWMQAEIDLGTRRLDANLARLDHVSRILVTDLNAGHVLANPETASGYGEAAGRVLQVFDQPVPALLLATDGSIVVDLAGIDSRPLRSGLAPFVLQLTEPRFVLLPSDPERPRSYVVRLRPVPLPDGRTGLLAVAMHAPPLLSNTLTLGPALQGRIGILSATGLMVSADAPPQTLAMPRRDALLAASHSGQSVPGNDPELGNTLTLVRPVAGGTLHAIVTISLADVEAAWRAHTLVVICVALFLMSLLITGLVLAGRQSRRRLTEEQAYARQLERHAEATAHLAAATDVDTLMRTATEWIRIIIPAHQSIASVSRNADFAQAIHAISFSDRYARWRTYDRPSDGSGIYRLVCRDNQPMRLTQSELVSHPAWRNFGVAREEHPPMRGWLAAPLIARDGSNLGLLQLTDRETGDFTELDESLLVQIARLISARLEAIDARAASDTAHAAAERARADAEAARAELARILSSISDGVCVVTRDWHIRYTNPHAAAMVSGRLEHGGELWSAAPEFVAARPRQRLESAMTEGRPVSFRIARASDSRVFDVRAFPFEDGLTIVLGDRTREAEIEAQLRQTQKMEALGQLTGGVAHDFNNLLTVILGNGDIIVETVGDNRIAANAARLLLTAAERASALTDRLLAFARRQPLTPRPVDVGTLVAETRELLTRTLGERIEVRVMTNAAGMQAMVDPGQLETALLNLALNARDAMPDGGLMTIETSAVHVGPDFAESHPGLEPGPYVLLSVSDTGHGMDRTVRSKAFEPFFTTKDPGRGSGLGLSMVYGFMRQSGGHAEITSVPGEGTTVRLYLPGDPHATVTAPSRTTSTPVPVGTERLLLVEDDALVREHVATTLAGLGYRVHAVADGAEAETLVARSAPFALMITDVVLPGPLNGRALAERLRSHQQGLKVLFISGYPEDEILRRDGAAALGASLLQKPFRRQDIAIRVRTTLDADVTSASVRASPPKSL